MLCNVKLVLFVIILSLFTIFVYNKIISSIVTVLRSELLLHNFIIEKLQN